jgi:hypothetical protein
MQLLIFLTQQTQQIIFFILKMQNKNSIYLLNNYFLIKSLFSNNLQIN